MNRVKYGLILGFGFIVACAASGCQSSSPSAVEVAPQPATRPPLLSAQVTRPINTTISQTQQDNILPAVSLLEVRGDVSIAGSNAMTPLVEAIAERFIDEGFSGGLTIEQIGSKEGFEMFCGDGKSDIAIASRPITASEQQACAAINRQPVALAVGSDILAIAVGKDNDFLTDVTEPELVKLFTTEYWSDVRPDWPQQQIRRTLPELGSGALQLFVREVFDGNAKALLQAANSEFFSEDEDYLVQALVIDPYAIAFFSYSYYERNQNLLSLVSVEGASPVQRDRYPFVRTLYLYADASTLRSQPQVGAFLNFFLTHVNEEISPLGYVPLRQEELDKTKTTLLTLISESISEDALK